MGAQKVRGCLPKFSPIIKCFFVVVVEVLYLSQKIILVIKMANVPVEMFMKPASSFCASAQNDNPSLLFYTKGENIGFRLKRSVNTLNIFDTQ